MSLRSRLWSVVLATAALSGCGRPTRTDQATPSTSASIAHPSAAPVSPSSSFELPVPSPCTQSADPLAGPREAREAFLTQLGVFGEPGIERRGAATIRMVWRSDLTPSAIAQVVVAEEGPGRHRVSARVALTDAVVIGLEGFDPPESWGQLAACLDRNDFWNETERPVGGPPGKWPRGWLLEANIGPRAHGVVHSSRHCAPLPPAAEACLRLAVRLYDPVMQELRRQRACRYPKTGFPYADETVECPSGDYAFVVSKSERFEHSTSRP